MKNGQALLMRLERAENAFMREMGWKPADEWNPDGDWKKGAEEGVWSRELALENAKADAAKEEA